MSQLGAAGSTSWELHDQRWELQDQRLLFADDLVLLASSQQSLQHALDRFSAACDRAGMKINTKNTGILCLSTNPRQCTL